jgi:ligand-binding sensor domain-containing protein/signal transduction histidine kinase
VLLFLLQSGFLYAHDEDYLIIRLGHPQLEKKNIESIVQDHTGFMWFGTGNGLLRFDGRHVRTLNHTIGSTKSLPVSRVRSVHIDRNGDIWASTQGGGLSLYQPDTNDFLNFLPQQDTSAVQRVNNYDFWSIEQGEGDELLISSYGGDVFYRFNTKTRGFQSNPVSVSDGNSFIATLTTMRRKNGEIWVGTDNDGIVVFSADGREIERYQHNSSDAGSLPGNSIRRIIEGPDGRIWIGSYGGGLSWYDPQTERFGRPAGLYGASYNYYANVYDLLFDHNGHLWVGSDDGIVVIDVYSNQLLRTFKHNPLNERSLVNNRVRALFQDRNGIIWVGNEHGGLHTFIRRTTFTYVDLLTAQGNPFNAPTVRSFLQLNEQTLWVGTEGGGINVVDMSRNRVTANFVHDPRNPQSVSNNGITALVRDSDGFIWVGTWGGGLNRYDPATGNFTRYLYRQGDRSTLSDNRVQLLHIDTKGRFWVGTENGLNLMDTQTGRFQRMFHNAEDPESLFGKSIQSLAFSEDTDDVYWIGTWHGLFRIDLKSDSTRRFTSNMAEPNSMSSDHILSIFDDQAGGLWLGTFDGGLIRFDKETQASQVFLDTDGVPSNVVYSVMPDESGYLWLSTNNGLSRFDPTSRFFRNFSEEDGLRNTEFWWGAAYKNSKGELMYGSTFGYVVFDPQSFIENEYIPQLAISRVFVLDEERVVPSSGNLSLSYSENYITIEFAALDYMNPRRNQYAYMLEGLDKTWIYSGNRNVVSYSSLAGGTYTFRVIGTNSDGVWNDTGVSLLIYIKPPFWQSVWFYLILVVLITGGVVGFIQLRTKQITVLNRRLGSLVSERTRDLAAKQEEVLRRNLELQEQAKRLLDQKKEIEAQQELILANSRELQAANEQLTLINQEKNNLIGIVAHDLRSPLATVISAVQILRMNPQMPAAEVEALYESMEQYIKGQLTMISKILDIEAVESGKIMLHPERVGFKGVFDRIAENYHAETERKHITVKSDFPDEEVFVRADVNYLGQVLDNLYSNALKFSPIGSTLKIGSLVTATTVRGYIRDQGPGLTPEDQRKLFGKFQKLSARPTGGEKSTGLGLSIVKRFTEAMDGRVWCESAPGDGATFFVEFPRG